MPPKDWNELTLSQQPAIDLLVEHLGYTHISGDTLRTDYRTGVILEDRLATSLKQINPFLDDISINKVIRKMTHPEDRGSSLIEINRALHEDMIKGISIKMDLGHGIKGQTVWYIDFENPENNDYLVVDEFRVKGQENCRADLVLFVNGLPLVVIECKSPRLTDPMFDGIDQLRRYQNVRELSGKEGCERLFYTNLLTCAIAGEEAKYGGIYTPAQHYGLWKDPWPLTEEQLQSKLGHINGQSLMLNTMMEKGRLLDILRNFTIFEEEDNKIVKKVCRYQQFRAVNKTLEKLKRREGGIIWHSTGSGKSLTMLYMGLKLKRELGNPNIVYVTDRIDLDEQLHGTFTRCGFPNPEHADSCDDLRQQLKDKQGLTILTTIHKFAKGEEHYPLNDDPNVYVLVDEAHRSQYKSFAANMRLALPEAVLVGFTGTPIDKKDKSTARVFGKYIDQYSIQQSVKDGATVPILYEGRLAEVKVEGSSLDELFDMYFSDYDDKAKAKIREKYGTEKGIMSSRKRIEMICADIIKHYEEHIYPEGYKAQIVAHGREAALTYKLVLDEMGHHKSALIVSVNANDEQKMKENAINKEEVKDTIKNRFKTAFDKGGDLSFIIVTDMLLTGFDAPIEQVMYIDKPLEDHTLLQAIARCNRTYPKKDYGLIVDYYGLSSNLKKALDDFDENDVAGIAKPVSELLPILEAKHNACLQYFSNLDEMEECVERLHPDDDRAGFKRIFKEMSKALNNVLPDPKGLKFVPDQKKLSIIYIEASRRYDREDVVSIKDCGEKVKQLIDEHILAHGINNLTEPVPIFSDGFMTGLEKKKSTKAKASEMEHAMKHTIKTKFDEDPVFWQSLQEKLEKLISEYHAKRITDVHFLDEVSQLREDAQNREKASSAQGFSHPAEAAIWGSLGNSEDYKNVSMAIYESISDLVVIDWTTKDDVIKGMRKTIKRKLREIKADDIEVKTTAIINLLKIHGKKPDVWEDSDSVQPNSEAAEAPKDYGSSERAD